MKTHKQSGFTLIELMIVVTIIGILAAVAVPLYRDYTIRSRVVGDIASVWNPLKTNISLYYNNIGSFPANLTDLAGETGVSNVATNHSGRYVRQMDIVGANTAANVTATMNAETNIGIGPAVTAGGAAGGVLVYTANVGTGSTIQWNISTTPTTLPEKYWPEKQR